MESIRPLSKLSVLEAAGRLSSHTVSTPVLTSSAIDRSYQTSLFFKGEHLQHTGSFKFRGAMNAALLAREAGEVGTLCTHSSGNHGAALAEAGRILGFDVKVVMPRGANAIKVNAVRRAGGEVIWCAASNQAREEKVAQIQRQYAAVLVPPFDDERVIAGQGTATLELLDTVEQLDAILVPVGGGGLLGGALLASEGVKVIGVEPDLANDTWRSFKSGERCGIDYSLTICDGLRASVGVRNFELIRRQASDILTVSEEAIVRATAQFWRDAKSFVEPSAAIVLAAVFENREMFRNQRIGAIVSGGNVDLSALQKPPYDRWMASEMATNTQ